MKTIRQSLCAFLALALLLSWVPMNVRAAETNSAQGVQFAVASESSMSAEGYERTESTQIAYSEYLPGHQDAALLLREAMKDHEVYIQLYVRSSESDYNKMVKDIWTQAVAHTGDPREGDSLGRQYDAYHWYTEWIIQDGFYYYMVEFNIDYYIDAEQHAQVDGAVEEILQELPLDSAMSDYEKVKVVFDWITHNVVYDHDHDATYKPRHSIWSAAVQRKTVCQGFCALMYRLLLEVGVDNRMVFGSTDGGVLHEWNIIALDGLYYNADATWDAPNGQSGSDYEWFLLGGGDPPTCYRAERFTTAEFLAAYPMAPSNYEVKEEPEIAPGDLDSSGAVNSDDAIYLLYHALFGDGLYPVAGDCDFDNNGAVDSDDAIYLLYHTLFGDALYPLR